MGEMTFNWKAGFDYTLSQGYHVYENTWISFEKGDAAS
jgi:hypothetical protein